ncbi:CubicO group peptidase (beta-lactamase class C family) [Loktanella sp. PT4BL]|jgi:CubicO group peptidase (beta-lactamase class C family)|uniref:serine hydrolase domain-containing protein n=1 Tax=Loktanella sp. PT4BL TaxID=2135611 RepID=UPI000D756F99|nr:serine hydrolase domain-containing protein [Loktanella sp. PT4BL]PXW72795.1 CubicO group peptidase (beta-lactamase class C family) [Loktanella sp. PT4BL]
MTLSQDLQALINAESAKPYSHNVMLRVLSGDKRVDFKGSAGTTATDTRFAIASISKMFTATLILQLADAGLIRLDQTVQSILPDVDLSGLHIVEGVDYSAELTVRHLLHQTSGLADYYESDLAADLKQGKDRHYDLDDVLQMTRALPPQAAPDSGKSFYSDTNYQLLGAVIEKVTGQSFDQALQARICQPTGLTDTKVLQGSDVGLPLHHHNTLLTIPRILASMAPDGGIISTLDEMLLFLRAYMQNRLFKPENATQARQWNRLFLPVQYGYGLMRIKLPRWMTLFRATPELIGHSGASGSFAYYAPEQDIYLIGSFNQTDAPQRPIGFMLQVLRLVANHKALK